MEQGGPMITSVLFSKIRLFAPPAPSVWSQSQNAHVKLNVKIISISALREDRSKDIRVRTGNKINGSSILD